MTIVALISTLVVVVGIPPYCDAVEPLEPLKQFPLESASVISMNYGASGQELAVRFRSESGYDKIRKWRTKSWESNDIELGKGCARPVWESRFVLTHDKLVAGQGDTIRYFKADMAADRSSEVALEWSMRHSLDHAVFESDDQEAPSLVTVIDRNHVHVGKVHPPSSSTFGELKTFFDVTTDDVSTVYLSRNRKLLAVGSAVRAGTNTIGRLEVWSTEGKGVLFRRDAHDGIVRSVTISEDNKWIATGGADGRLNIWEIETGRLQYAATRPRSISSITIDSGTGLVMVSSLDKGDEGNLLLLDLRAKKLLYAVCADLKGVWTASLSPDRRQIAVGGSDRFIRVWNTESIFPDFARRLTK